MIATAQVDTDPRSTDHRLLLKYSRHREDPNKSLGRLGSLAAMAEEYHRTLLQLKAQGFSELEITRLVQHGSVLAALVPELLDNEPHS
jgi:hypothetical protein